MIVMNDSVKRHRGARTCAAVWLGMTLTAVTSVAQGQLPDGPGKNTTKKVCGQCHSAEVVVGKGKTKEEWGQTVGEMASFDALHARAHDLVPGRPHARPQSHGHSPSGRPVMRSDVPAL